MTESRYRQLIKQAGLVDESPVKGFSVLLSYGYAIWEQAQQVLDQKLKGLGYKNASFPSFIPISQLKKQEEHYKSLVREAAICTHAGDTEMKEKLVIRPTSEAVIAPAVRRWIRSHRDLPLRLNQWCNIVRMEILKPNLPIIRDNEFLWHEAHSFFSTQKECDEEAQKLYDMYIEFIQNYLAIPIFKGRKPERRKFPGAVYTLALEAMMQDHKSVQIATSHSLGQNFSKAFDIKADDFVWYACAGLTTRIIGAIAMVHSDGNGLILPPMIAPYQVAVVDGNTRLKGFRTVQGGTVNEWVLKGVPLIISDDKILRRDTMQTIKIEKKTDDQIAGLLLSIQNNLFKRADRLKEQHTTTTDDYQEMKKVLSAQEGFVIAPWCGNTGCSLNIRKETKGSLRLVNPGKGKCIKCNRPVKHLALFGQSY
ncbi:MAG: proline--tRNA ligase [Nanoarchaeota archaeon]|nr:proline--tRNA ligase [Nanoarchaeota archaeon]